MRDLGQDIDNTIKTNNEAIFFTFKIKTFNQTFYLTNNVSDQIFNGQKYIATGLDVVKIQLTDDGKDFSELVWPKDELSSKVSAELDGAEFDIYIIWGAKGSTHHLMKSFHHSTLQESNSFRVYLKNLTEKLNQDLVKNFSRTCRARLGDVNCAVVVANFTQTVNVLAIDDEKIHTDCTQPSGYYNYGKINIVGTQIYITILRQEAGALILERKLPAEFSHLKTISISPGCDKTINTCHVKFYNAINFRGEPFIAYCDINKKI